MLYYIGINQKKIEEFNESNFCNTELDLKHGILIYYLKKHIQSKFADKTKIKYKNKDFYLLCYKNIIQQLPYLKITNKQVIGRKIKDLVENGIIEMHLKKEINNGTKVYFSTTEIFNFFCHYKNKLPNEEINNFNNFKSLKENNEKIKIDYNDSFFKRNTNEFNEIEKEELTADSLEVIKENFDVLQNNDILENETKQTNNNEIIFSMADKHKKEEERKLQTREYKYSFQEEFENDFIDKKKENYETFLERYEKCYTEKERQEKKNDIKKNDLEKIKDFFNQKNENEIEMILSAIFRYHEGLNKNRHGVFQQATKSPLNWLLEGDYNKYLKKEKYNQNSNRNENQDEALKIIKDLYFINLLQTNQWHFEKIDLQLAKENYCLDKKNKLFDNLESKNEVYLIQEITKSMTRKKIILKKDLYDNYVNFKEEIDKDFGSSFKYKTYEEMKEILKEKKIYIENKKLDN